MNRKIKFYYISNKYENNIEKTIKRLPKIMTRYWNLKICKRQISNSKIVNEFKRKNQIKTKSFHIRFSSSKSKINSCLKTSLLKKLMFLIILASKNFIQIRVTLILKRVYKMAQVFSSIFIQRLTNIHIENWLFRAMLKGFTSEP